MAPATRPRSSSAATLAAALALATPGVAAAQAYQCRAPATLPAAARAETGQPRRVATTGHTLALSWSPEFCRGKERDARQRLQCAGPAAGGAGRFGFVVHGLWPEGASTWPEWCRKVPPPAPALVRRQLCRTPSIVLIGHAWAKHGSCMTRRPEAYFQASNLLAASIRYPATEALSRDGERTAAALTAGKLREAFAAANPGRPARSFGLKLSHGGWLQEIYVCLDRRFRPARCPARQFGPGDAATLKIWRGL